MATVTLRTQARDEAYASARVDAMPRPVVRLDNPAFDKPLYFMQGIEEQTTIRNEDGVFADVIPCAFKCTLPGFDDSGPTPAKLIVDNVALQIYPYLRLASGPISVTYLGYLGDDLYNVADLVEGLKLKVVNLSSTTAEGELVFEEIATQNFPRRTYSLTDYPSLWNS